VGGAGWARVAIAVFFSGAQVRGFFFFLLFDGLRVVWWLVVFGIRVVSGGDRDGAVRLTQGKTGGASPYTKPFDGKNKEREWSLCV